MISLNCSSFLFSCVCSNGVTSFYVSCIQIFTYGSGGGVGREPISYPESSGFWSAGGGQEILGTSKKFKFFDLAAP